MIPKRYIQIIVATATLLVLAGAAVVGCSGNDDESAPPAPPVPALTEGGASSHARGEYGQGYESRHGRPAAGRTDPPNHHPSKESSP